MCFICFMINFLKIIRTSVSAVFDVFNVFYMYFFLEVTSKVLHFHSAKDHWSPKVTAMHCNVNKNHNI